jgi:peptidoglycan/xylan/chitin deacetylase (PgdA/CDA1 family)
VYVAPYRALAPIVLHALVTCCLLGCTPAPPPAVIRKPGLTEQGLRGDALPPRTVIFTYDDGPDEHTRELAAYLDEENIRATFFINGRRICKVMSRDGQCVVPPATRRCGDGNAQVPVDRPHYYPESLLDELVDHGQRLANHSENHCNLPGEHSANAVVFELESTHALLERHVPDGAFLFRPPYGSWNAQTLERTRTSTSLDVLSGPILWDIDGADFGCWRDGVSVEECGRRYLDLLEARPQRNGIFLMHDRPEHNVGYEGPLLLTRWLVPRLKEAGYHFADFDDLFAALPEEPISLSSMSN